MIVTNKIIASCLLACAVGSASADVLENNGFSTFDPRNTWPGNGPAPGPSMDRANIIGQMAGPGPDVYSVQTWIEQDILLPTAAKLNTLTLTIGYNVANVTINGQTFSAASTLDFAPPNGAAGYFYETFNLAGLSSGSTLHIKVDGTFTVVGGTSTSSFAPNAWYHGIEYNDQWQVIDDGTYPSRLDTAVMFSLNYTPDVAAPVPEPETYLMMLTGLTLLAGRRLRRKNLA